MAPEHVPDDLACGEFAEGTEWLGEMKTPEGLKVGVTVEQDIACFLSAVIKLPKNALR